MTALREPRRDNTHALTIPGTAFLAFVTGEDAALALAGKLAKTKVGKRTKAQPVVRTVAEWEADRAA